MMYKLREAAGKAFYALRKQVAEPVFGIIKERMGFRRFMVRGLKKVKREWAQVVTCYNLKRMFILSRSSK
jgi:hypothetical protein